MIRMIQSRNAAHAKAYFSEALSKSDYYVSDQELAGVWQGRLAERLGLRGEAGKEAFFALVENRHPMTLGSLTPRTKEARTTGYDINFHCPKSVSILHAFSPDDHILKAFRESVLDTMRTIEADGKTRVRQKGLVTERDTEELAWAHFVHQTARPVAGAAPDPHLHSHCYVFNATWDGEEKRIKAAQFRDIKRDMPYYQARFHKTLADKLAALGYQIRRTDKSFEIDGVPQQALDLFSKRTDEIGRAAKEKGITDPKELADLGARTRAKKEKGYSMAELKRAWLEQARMLDTSGAETAIRHAPAKETMRSLTAQECIDHALLHCFERASVMDARRILEIACRHGLGSGTASPDEMERLFHQDQRIIHVTEKGRTLCTTKEVLKEEKRMVELARAQQGRMNPLYAQAPALALKGQQASAVAHVLTTRDRISIIRGAAGSGKTTLMKEAVARMEAAGKTVTVVAPTSQASRGVLREEGFTGAETVAKLLVDQKMQQNLKGQVLWVDEAGLLGVKDMTALLEITAKQDARLILGGDTRQHASVVRGDALRILNTVAGVRTAEVSKIYRQKSEDYRAAVEDLSQGNVAQAFKKLDGMGAIKTVDLLRPNAALAGDYIETVKRGKSALVISPTHAQGEEVTAEIRAGLRKEGLLGKKEIAATQLKNLNLTAAEKADARNFKTGYVVRFDQNAPGFTRGSLWTVEEGLRVKNEKGEVRPLPTEKSERYSVYARQEIPLAKGDKVMITRNGFDADKKRLNNGDMLDVVSVSKSGKVTLRNRLSRETYALKRDFGHIAHAHCITSQASQGKTVDEVLIYQPASTFPATDSKQFYVSVSRGRERARIYTDNKEDLLRHAGESGERRSALELTDRTKHKDAVVRIERQKTKPKQNKDHELD